MPKKRKPKKPKEKPFSPDIDSIAMGLKLGKSRAMYLLNETVNGFKDMLADDSAFDDFDDITAEGKRNAVESSLSAARWILQYVDEAWDKPPEESSIAKEEEELEWDKK